MFILIVAATLIIGASAILTAFPSNSAVTAGNEVILECRTNTYKKLIWRQRRLSATEIDGQSEIIFTGNKFDNEAAQKYDIIRESVGQFDLKFNATLNHGSEYMCIEPGEETITAQLIVLASEPKCYVNGMPVTSNLIVVDDEEFIELSCNLTFAGRWRPNMEWMQQINSKNDWMVIANQEETENRYKIYSSSTTLTLHAVHNVTSYKCKTQFLSSDRPKTTTAKNIPDYSYSWTSPTFVLRTFYEINCRRPGKEQNVGNIDLANKDAGYNSATNNSALNYESTTRHSPVNTNDFGSCALVVVILAVLLFISVSITISVTLYFVVCRRKTEEIDVNLATASSGISAGRMSSAYEQVDVELTQSGINYSALIRSEVTHPETNYETINQSSS